MKYCMDSNFFMTAWRGYYSPEIAPDFWDWLYTHVEAGTIFIPQEVYDEIEIGKDKLFDWIKAKKNEIVYTLDDKIQDLVSEIMTLPEAIQLADSNKKDNNADVFVVAYAKQNNATVVTNDTGLIRLCKACEVRYLRDYEFLKEKQLRMVVSK